MKVRVTIETKVMKIRSKSLTDNIFPNSRASKFLTGLWAVLIKKIPIANPAVVTTPIAASAFILYLLFISVINSADKIPHIAAPTYRFNPII